MNIFLISVIELMFHVCLSQNIVFRNDSLPKSGFGNFVLAIQSASECNLTEKVDKHFYDNVKVHFKPETIDTVEYFVTTSLKENRRVVKLYWMIELLKDGKFIKVLEHTSNSPCVDPIGKKLIVARAIQNESQCLLRPGNFSSPVQRPGDVLGRATKNKFFYGIGKALLMFHSENGLGFCETIIFISKPRKSKKKN